ncbi:MAG: tetratricopeptide repeat protein [Bryobacterales bacterium]|nr:tetratricopeptide repeat protein [Bryobacterales bacterium]
MAKKTAPKTTPVEPAAVVAPVPADVRRYCAVLFLICLAVFWPATNNDFVLYDDLSYIHQNPPVRSGLSLDGIFWALTSVEKYYWHPLAWISHMVDVSVFGLNASGHHAVSVVLHALNAAALLLAVWRLTGALWPAALVAALHSLHPLRVESVAWAAERKDVLSGLFFSLALLAYANYVRGSKRAYWGFLGAAAAAYCSKPTVVPLPVILLILDWWPLGRTKTTSWVALIREKAPVIAMSAAVSLLTIAGQREVAMFTLGQLPLDMRIRNAMRGYGGYLEKFFYPLDLGVFYPHEELGAGAGFVLALAIGLPFVGAWVLRTRAPYVAAGWLWFVVAMLPTSGLLQSGQQAYADRFTYIPAVGLAMIVVFGAAELLRPAPVAVRAAVAGCVLLVLAALSVNQIQYWKDTDSMALRAIAVTKKNPNMHWLLADKYMGESRYDDALQHYRQLTVEYPEYPDAYRKMGNILMRKKEYAQALAPIDTAIRLKPEDVELRKLRSLALIQMGRTNEALEALRNVLRMSPSDPQARQWLQAIGGEAGR